MILVQVTSDNYAWNGKFDDDSAGLAFAKSNSLWVEQLNDSDQNVLAARFRYDGKSLVPEYLVAQGQPGQIYIVKVFGFTVRRGLTYQVLQSVTAKTFAPIALKSKVRKVSRKS